MDNPAAPSCALARLTWIQNLIARKRSPRSFLFLWDAHRELS